MSSDPYHRHQYTDHTRPSSSSASRQRDGQQQYSSQQQVSYPTDAYPPQGSEYQTLSSATHGYMQAGSEYQMPHQNTYPGATVPFSQLRQPPLNRAVSTPAGHQYPVHGQYAGSQAQTIFPNQQYPYATMPSLSSRPVGTRSPPHTMPLSPHARHSSSSSLHQPQTPPSPELERYPCGKCDKTFSRAHDRKRHYETQHSVNPPVHKCQYCGKEFSRNDSLKRHLDNGCEKDPSYVAAQA